ncbi:MAG: 3'(2'),5'-bisphosphate nucleotidase CysQ, partial [Gammaproteobacteria bacterium]|nr:3'(2'),5'-bisphosphate nucleotidase CysQ [Gammaproteobacteria bacterium]
MSESLNLEHLCNQCVEIAREAGERILEIYNSDYKIEEKDDKSPLTDADLAAHNTIVKALTALTPDIPILSEESAKLPFEVRKEWQTYWLVDPLDGTKEFIKRNGEFTVNIALIEKNIPVLGVIYIPVRQSLYFANVHLGSYKINNIVSTNDLNSLSGYFSKGKKLPLYNQNETFTIVGSKSHMTEETEEFIQELEKVHGKIEVISKGSSLKICMVAEGKADIYP